MRRSIVTPILALAFLAPLHAIADDPVIHERIEWSDIWVTNANTDAVPRVLLVGDSIVRGYYDGVEKALGDGVNLARYTTSKFAGNPDYLAELGVLLRRYDFDIIHINNGLHGFGYTAEDYRLALQRLMEFLAKEEPTAHVIWAMSTPMRDSGDLTQLGEQNDQVIERNRIAGELMPPLGIAGNDLYTPVADHPEYFSNDGVHFNEQGKAVHAAQVARAIEEALKG